MENGNLRNCIYMAQAATGAARNKAPLFTVRVKSNLKRRRGIGGNADGHNDDIAVLGHPREPCRWACLVRATAGGYGVPA